MRLEQQFSPMKLCLDSKSDKDLLELICYEYLKNRERSWVGFGSRTERDQENYNRVRNLLELLK